MSGPWLVGQVVPITARFTSDDGEVTAGAATVRIYRDNAGTFEYLQVDNSSWSTTAYDHATSYVADIGWTKHLTVPSSADGYIVTTVMTHDDPDFEDRPSIENWYVGTYDNSDIAEALRKIQGVIA